VTIASSSTKPGILLSHPTGNQNVRNALLALVEYDMLAEFWTTIAWNPESPCNRLLPYCLRRQLARREFPEAPKRRLRFAPWREVVRLGVRSTPLESVLCSEERPFSVIGVYRNFDTHVARRLRGIRVEAVYAYEGGALETFREAKRQGILTIYDLPSGHWYWERELLRKERERNPSLASVIPKLLDSERHMREKDEELALADIVIVASQHVRRSLAGVVADPKIKVVPYGAPPVHVRPERPCESGQPLKVLFAGALQQRKGISYLLEAVSMLGSDVELTLIGRRVSANATVDTACGRARWFQTIPHSQVLEVMLHSDVLVLPSLSEGFGLVVTEALACGLPVIVTPNVGASDLICDGREGFVVPAQSAESIANRLDILNRDRDLLAQMSRNAQKSAAENSWKSYRTTLAETVRVASWR
jgi:starch synthase